MKSRKNIKTLENWWLTLKSFLWSPYFSFWTESLCMIHSNGKVRQKREKSSKIDSLKSGADSKYYIDKSIYLTKYFEDLSQIGCAWFFFSNWITPRSKLMRNFICRKYVSWFRHFYGITCITICDWGEIFQIFSYIFKHAYKIYKFWERFNG